MICMLDFRNSFAIIMSGFACGLMALLPPRAKAQVAHDSDVAAHLQSHAQEYEWFNHAANGYDGVPFLLLRLLPEVEPEIWGQPDERFGRFGFRSTKND